MTPEKPFRWYIPSHNGDVRFEHIDDKSCSLITADLTSLETPFQPRSTRLWPMQPARWRTC